jgi:hypothetical protein
VSLPGAAATLVAAGLIVASLAGGAAWAADVPRSVTVFQPANAGDALVEIATRTAAELVAGGFTARIVECSVSSGRCVGGAGRGGDAGATVATFEYRGETLIEVTATPYMHGDPGAVLQVVRAEDSGVAPRVLAIRAVELLRATLLEAAVERAEPADARAPVAAPVGTVAQEFPSDEHAPTRAMADGWSFAVGAGRLTTSSRVDSAYGGMNRVGYRWPSGAGLSLLIALIELTPDLQVAAGTLSAHQELALFEGSIRFRVESRVEPYVTGGLGGYHLAVRGNVAAQPGLVGQTVDAWQAVATVGGGVAIVVATRFELFAEGQLMAAYPRVLVANGLEEIAGPRLMISSGVQWIF